MPSFCCAHSALAQACDSLKMTALHFACRHGHGDITKILLSKGADANAKDEKGVCPLHFAAYHGHLQCVRELCDVRADLTVQEGGRKHGATPLFRSLAHMAVVELLLQRGATIRDDPSFPVHAAVTEGHMDVAKLLLESGGDLHGTQEREPEERCCAPFIVIVELIHSVFHRARR